MLCDVAEEGGTPIATGIFIEADVVGVGGADCVVEESADGVDTVRIVAVSVSRRSKCKINKAARTCLLSHARL